MHFRLVKGPSILYLLSARDHVSKQFLIALIVVITALRFCLENKLLPQPFGWGKHCQTPLAFNTGRLICPQDHVKLNTFILGREKSPEMLRLFSTYKHVMEEREKGQMVTVTE